MGKAKTRAGPVRFYTYSSYNKRGGRMHPLVSRRTNQVLDKFAAMMTIEAIADELSISIDTVKRYIARGRRRGDPRATRPGNLNRKRIKGRMRRHQIQMLSEAGLSPAEIADQLDCSPRLVRMRVKEAAT